MSATSAPAMSQFAFMMHSSASGTTKVLPSGTLLAYCWPSGGSIGCGTRFFIGGSDCR